MAGLFLAVAGQWHQARPLLGRLIVGDLAWSAVAVLAARRLLRPPGPPPPA